MSNTLSPLAQHAGRVLKHTRHLVAQQVVLLCPAKLYAHFQLSQAPFVIIVVEEVLRRESSGVFLVRIAELSNRKGQKAKDENFWSSVDFRPLLSFEHIASQVRMNPKSIGDGCLIFIDEKPKPKARFRYLQKNQKPV